MVVKKFPWAIAVGAPLVSAPLVALIGLSSIPVQAQTGEDSACNNHWVNPQTGQPECLDLGSSSQPTEQAETPSSPSSEESPESSVIAYPPTVKYGPCYYIWQFDFRGRRCGERALEEQQRRLRQSSTLDSP